MTPATTGSSPNGERVVDNEAVQRSRLRVDARKWAASKLLPKVCGDRVVTELGNATGDDGKPIPLAMDVVNKTEQALAVLRAKLAEARNEAASAVS